MRVGVREQVIDWINNPRSKLQGIGAARQQTRSTQQAAGNISRKRLKDQDKPLAAADKEQFEASVSSLAGLIVAFRNCPIVRQKFLRVRQDLETLRSVQREVYRLRRCSDKNLEPARKSISVLRREVPRLIKVLEAVGTDPLLACLCDHLLPALELAGNALGSPKPAGRPSLVPTTPPQADEIEARQRICELKPRLDDAAALLGEPRGRGDRVKPIWPVWAAALMPHLQQVCQILGRGSSANTTGGYLEQLLCRALQAIDDQEDRAGVTAWMRSFARKK
jgi:hypothetical protein